MSSQVVEDDETFFVQIQKTIDFTEENYLKVKFIPLIIEELGVKTLSLEEKVLMLIFLGLTNIYFLMVNLMLILVYQ